MFEVIEAIIREISDGIGDAAESVMKPVSDWFETGSATDSVASLEALNASAERVSADFGMPPPEVYSAPLSLGEHRMNNPTTLFDDQVGADPRIVDMINKRFGDARAYDVIMAHEMTHGQIAASGLRDVISPQSEEVLCDINAGFYAGTKDIDADVFHGVVGQAGGDAEHPVGSERSVFFDKAYRLANGYVFKDFQPITKDPLQAERVMDLYEEVLAKYNG